MLSPGGILTLKIALASEGLILAFTPPFIMVGLITVLICELKKGSLESISSDSVIFFNGFSNISLIVQLPPSVANCISVFKILLSNIGGIILSCIVFVALART